LSLEKAFAIADTEQARDWKGTGKFSHLIIIKRVKKKQPVLHTQNPPSCFIMLFVSKKRKVCSFLD
jgi:hypothetical protein